MKRGTVQRRSSRKVVGPEMTGKVFNVESSERAARYMCSTVQNIRPGCSDAASAEEGVDVEVRSGSGSMDLTDHRSASSVMDIAL